MHGINLGKLDEEINLRSSILEYWASLHKYNKLEDAKGNMILVENWN